MQASQGAGKKILAYSMLINIVLLLPGWIAETEKPLSDGMLIAPEQERAEDNGSGGTIEESET